MRLLTIFALLLFTAVGLNAQEKKSEGIVANIKKGIASFYHDKFEGRKTATGEIFDNDKFTAASNKIKLGEYVKVTNEANGQVVYVRINDRMAKSNTRAIDLASIAAKKLNIQGKGIAKVTMEVVTHEEGRMAISMQKAITKNEL